MSKQNEHIQHVQLVFGRNEGERTPSQQYLVKWLEEVVDADVFARSVVSGTFCDTAAKLTEGKRMLAKQLLKEISANLKKPEKPTVTT